MLSGVHRFPRQDQVIYGRPAAEAVRELAGQYGVSRILIVTTASLADTLARRMADDLGVLCAGVFAGIGAHAPRAGVMGGANEARRVGADLLLALGGGSVIDATKVMQLALWAGLTEADQLDDYRARGADRARVEAIPAGVRMAAVPTTLSAAEFTAIGGARNPARNMKEAFAHPLMAPLAVVLDPRMTLETPPALWFSTGLKAVDHAVEQLCNPEPAPYADALAADGLQRLARGLAAVRAAPDDLDARLDCQFGMWLTVSGAGFGRPMGPSHAIGHALGGRCGVPHGVTSCIALPAVLAWTQGVISERQVRIAELMGAPGLSAAAAVKGLAQGLDLPTDLKSVGIGREDFEGIAAYAFRDPGVRASPRPIERPEQIVEILELAAG